MIIIPQGVTLEPSIAFWIATTEHISIFTHIGCTIASYTIVQVKTALALSTRAGAV